MLRVQYAILAVLIVVAGLSITVLVRLPTAKPSYSPVALMETPDAWPQPIELATPVYPNPARDAGITGAVVVRALVNERGKVVSAAIGRSSGNGDLDEAAKVAALQSTFKPAQKSGKPAAVWVNVPFAFTITQQGG